MGWQPGGEDETGPGVPGSGSASRNPQLAGFAAGGEWDTCAPGPELATALAGVAGPSWRCPGAEPGELIGVLGRLAALESWAAAARLGVIRELIRQDDVPVPGRPSHGDLPDEWSDSLNHEIALASATSVGSAQATAMLAWQLGARLPGVASLLASGKVSYGKAKLIAETFQWLTDEDAATAEALLLTELAGPGLKTYGQLMNLTARIAAQVDPNLAERRRKAAVRHGAKVSMFREASGAAGLSGRELPADETLAANANVCARAAEYKASGAFGDARMDQYRATAYLDLLNQVAAVDRIAHGRLSTDDATTQTVPEAGPGAEMADPGSHGDGHLGAGSCLQRPVDLVIPLATLLGLAERPGEGHGLGPLDPSLCRHLATAAIASPRTELCVTVTNPDGMATSHGCGRQARANRVKRSYQNSQAPGQRQSLSELPARLNLTVTSTLLAWLAEISKGGGVSGPRASCSWALTRNDSAAAPRAEHSGPPGSDDPRDGYGTWTLTLPDGRALTVRLEPVPTFGCDHRHESHGYQPGDMLRHLVQIRDYECTNPVCSRHARDTDFEHAIPYDKGGRTCACNAGARSRSCHRIKQSVGWKVTQPRPGWHQWETPRARTYTQEPKRYPT